MVMVVMPMMKAHDGEYTGTTKSKQEYIVLLKHFPGHFFDFFGVKLSVVYPLLSHINYKYSRLKDQINKVFSENESY